MGTNFLPSVTVQEGNIASGC